MELDELKKSWNVLDSKLQKEPVADEEQIKQLITTHKANTRKSQGCIFGLQRLSIVIGALGLIILFIAWMMLPAFAPDEQQQCKFSVLFGFIAVSIIGGMWWDWKTYRWNKATLIDEMSVAQVSRRMNTLRQWTKYEVVAISIWIVLFNILNYWVMNYYRASAGAQALLIALFVIFDVLIIYLLYKKVVYKHLDNIKKNIEELKDICIE